LVLIFHFATLVRTTSASRKRKMPMPSPAKRAPSAVEP